MLVFQKVARSCSLTKKLLKILKVAEKLPSRIWIDLGTISIEIRANPLETETGTSIAYAKVL